MSVNDFSSWVQSALDQRRTDHRFRQRRTLTPLDSTHVLLNNQRYTNFSSNNYLGLTHHPAILQSLRDSAQLGAGSASASLITGHTVAHAAAESALAQWKSTEASLLLPSGYQANHAVIQTLAALGEQSRGVRFLIDKLSHASLIDAVRATGSPFRVFPHNHLPKLKRLLTEAPPDQIQVVITESIFSMDGDSCDLPALASLKQSHPFLLVLDEAHATGVYGPNGSGLAAELHLSHLPDLTILTLSKALGLSGGAICASQHWIDAILNFGRAAIYTTNIPPSTAAATLTALQILSTEPHRQQRVRDLARRVRDALTAANFQIPPGDSPIIPILLGSESAALDFSHHLEQQHLLVLPIRPPTVPPNTSRLRITLSSDHTDSEIDHLIQSIKKPRM